MNIKTMKKRAVAMAAAVIGFSGWAGTEIGADTAYEDWPSEGEVVVTSGPIVITDEVVDKVNGWSKLTMTTGITGTKRLTIKDTTKPLVLPTLNVCTMMTITNCSSVTFSGERTGWMSNYGWEFIDSNVYVAHENALTTKNRDNYVTVIFSANAPYGALTFYKPEWDEEGWTGKKVFTNNSHLVFKTIASADKASTHYRNTIGSRSNDEYLVQNADFLSKPSGSTGYIYFRGNYEQIDGMFGNNERRGQSHFFHPHPDFPDATVKLSGTTKVVMAEVKSGDTVTPNYGSGCDSQIIYLKDFYLGHTGKRHAGLQVCPYATIHFEAENMFDIPTECEPPEGASATQCKNMSSLLCMYSSDTDAAAPVVELNGFNQEVNRFCPAYGYSPSASSTGYFYVNSDTPAVLTVTQLGIQSCETNNVAPRFTGKAGFTLDRDAVLGFCTYVSSPNATLTVKKGTLAFKWNGGWDGTNTVVTGGLIDCESTKSFSDGHSALTMTGGKLKLHSGSTVKFKAAKIGETTLDYGTYTVTALNAMGLGDYIDESSDASARLVVEIPSYTITKAMKDSVEEWPENCKVKLGWVSGGWTLDIDSAAKAAKAATWYEVQTPDGATYINFCYSDPITFKAKITGNGGLKAKDAGLVTLTGDNSAYTGTGDWTFENTAVHIGSEYALGPAGSNHRLVLKAPGGSGAQNTRWLSIGWEGASSFTNHTHIAWISNNWTNEQHTDNPSYPLIGPSNADEWFVQDGDMLYIGNGSPWFYFVGQYEQISGRLGRTFTSAWALYTYGASSGDYKGGKAVCRFTGTGRIIVGPENTTVGGSVLSSDLELEFGSASGYHHAGINMESGVIRVLADHALIDCIEGAAYAPLNPKLLNQSTAKNRIELNGHDVEVAGLARHYANAPSATSTYYTPVYSDTAATITLTNAPSNVKSYNTAMEFNGPISITVDNGITNIFATKVSPSTGTMKINNGTLTFKWGGGWSSAVIVDGGVFDAMSVNSLSGANATLEVKRGSVNLYSGTTLLVKSAKFGETTLSEGVHTGAELKAAYPELVTGDDDGAIEVVGEWTSFDGTGAWPTSGKICVPAGTTLVIDDVTKLEAASGWSKVWLSGSASILKFATGASAVTWSVPAKGAGQIQIIDAEAFTLSADNTELAGSVHIENSEVNVTSETGLGGATSGIAELKFGNTRRVRFQNGSNAFTNEAPIRLSFLDATTSRIRLGEGIEGYRFVQKGDVYLKEVGNSAGRTIYYFGQVEYLGRIVVESYVSASAVAQRAEVENGVTAKVYFAPTVTFVNPNNYTLSFNHGGNGHDYLVNVPEYHYQCAATQTAMSTLQFNVPDIYIESDAIFGSVEEPITALYYFGDVGGSSRYYLNTLHLEGHDVPFRSFASQYTPTAETHYPGSWAEVTSPTAAQLVYCGTQTRFDNLRFRGKAGFTMNGEGAIKLANFDNDTTGLLKAQKGVAGLVWGATWGGNVEVCGTGKLFIDAESAAVNAIKAAALTIADSGVVEVELGTIEVKSATVQGAAMKRGIYGAVGSGAENEVSWITGSGFIKVKKGVATGVKLFIGAGAARKTDAKLSFGVLSDIHLAANNDATMDVSASQVNNLKSAFNYFDQAGVDAIVVPGDVANGGLKKELQTFMNTFFEVFPNYIAADGRKVELVIITGNHDAEGYESYATGYKKQFADDDAYKAACINGDHEANWKAIVGEDYRTLSIRKIRGYNFITYQYENAYLPELPGFLSGLSGEMSGNKPFFVIQHPHPKDTCFGSWAWGHDGGFTTKALTAYPSAVIFSGHAHYTFTDERAIWQNGSFTSVGMPSFYSASFTTDEFKNNGGIKNSDTDYGCKQAMLVSVYDDRIVYRRHDVLNSRDVGDDWVQYLSDHNAFSISARATASKAPAFVTGAALSVSGSTVTVPACVADKDARVYFYEIEVSVNGGEASLQRFIANGWARAETDPIATQSTTCACTVTASEGDSVTFTVYPVNSFGKRGEPLAITVEQ